MQNTSTSILFLFAATLIALPSRAQSDCSLGDVRDCTLTSGCNGIQKCDQRIRDCTDGLCSYVYTWGSCKLSTDSRRNCTCGTQAGTQACFSDGTFGSCEKSCSCASEAGKQTCINEKFSDYCARPCTACNGGGVQTCSLSVKVCCGAVNSFGPCTPESNLSTIHEYFYDTVCDQCDLDGNGLLGSNGNPLSPTPITQTTNTFCSQAAVDTCTNFGTWQRTQNCGGTASCSANNGVSGTATCNLDCTLTACWSNSSLSERTWTGDFLPRNTGTAPSLRKFKLVDSGGAPENGARTHPCTNNLDGGFGNCETDPFTAQPLNQGGSFCPAGDAFCRFIVSTPPIGQPNSTDFMLKVTTKDGDTLTTSGRTNPRNELAQPWETIAGVTRAEIVEGDDRYYAWEALIPTATTGADSFPPPPATGVPGWHVMFQFHEVGICSSQAPVLTFGLNAISTNGGPREWKWLLKGKETYSNLDSVELWKSPTSIQRGQWHKFVLHVKWARTRCTNCTDVPYRYTSSDGTVPNGGVIELWVDGQHEYSGSHVTMYSWPTKSEGVDAGVYGTAIPNPGTTCNDCDCNSDYCKCEFPTGWMSYRIGEYMPVILKTGLYRDVNMGAPETVYMKGYTAGTTCAGATGTADNCPAPQ